MAKYLFFDLDGTLTDSSEGICNSYAYALDKLGVKNVDRASLTKYIGPPLSVGFADFFEGERINEAVKAYRERYEVIGWKENRVYDGIPEALERLKNAGYTLVVATSKPERFAKYITEHFGLQQYFTYVCGASTDGRISTKAEVFQHALDTSGARCEDIVMIGDRFYDVEGAKAFGVDTIGVTFGFGTREELVKAGAVSIADTPAEIADLLGA